MSEVLEKIKNALTQPLPMVPKDIPVGDMPGDKVDIDAGHIKKAGILLPVLMKELLPHVSQNPHERAVVSVYGGSGVGKSEIASLLCWFFNHFAIGAYVLSGDNYPYRIPALNDAERLRIFRTAGLDGLISSGIYSKEMAQRLQLLQPNQRDLEKSDEYWLAIYQNAGRMGLRSYLGTDYELEFSRLNHIISQFKNGLGQIYLKRMGRTESDLRYDLIDFSHINILIIEWTHGNSNDLIGVDVPVLLDSTPKQTLAHRLKRNRDGAADSLFTGIVLEIEQNILYTQKDKARIIVSKSGALLKPV